MLDSYRGRTKTGQLFAYAGDEWPCAGADPPGVAYLDSPDRKAEQPIRHLQGISGVLHIAVSAGYKALAEKEGRQPGLLLVTRPAQVL